MSDTVTISKEYFDTLLRRTQVQPEGTIILPQYEFDFLLKSTKEYTTLRAALIHGGVDAVALDVLINTANEEAAFDEKIAGHPSPLKPRLQKWSAQATPFVPKPPAQIQQTVNDDVQSGPHHHKEWPLSTATSTSPGDFEELNYDGVSPVNLASDNQQYGYGQYYEQEEEDSFDVNREDRSVVLKGISPFTTLADVLAVIRGGAVLNLYLRPQQRTAHVTFVDPNAAENFLIHSKRIDIYVRGKRVEVFWDDRQHFLPGYLAQRIHNNGATRNLVIRFAKADMTEKSICEDLDHIYRLEIVKVHFEFGHAWISLNSVQQAVTARSCMGSRFKYKGTRIEFYPDECAEPLPPYVKRQPQSQPATLRSKKSTYSFNNKFASLTVDDECRSIIGFGSSSMVRV